jgi:hypothetical protein
MARGLLFQNKQKVGTVFGSVPRQGPMARAEDAKCRGWHYYLRQQWPNSRSAEIAKSVTVSGPAYSPAV